MREPKRNMAASVQARLLNIAKERKQPFDLLLTRYVLERLLYRLSRTRHRDRFVLKGAMLLTTWFDNPLRPTRDLDLPGSLRRRSGRWRCIRRCRAGSRPDTQRSGIWRASYQDHSQDRRSKN